ncbi:MAG TPA: hypothetical protein PLL80_02215 [Candidatus Pacearchaeota archaeon]|nr:hypothetical protein [Candidatus Pacearchaeota archaeon]HOK94218.1 hypothetical protein [Candidatus Pacearchaeota archaeon]HPO75398.1 hypothetical protein [Candidatus Pacearchaeota archaeon]
MSTKSLLFIILGVLLLGLGIYGLIFWWWPIFVKLFLAALGPILIIVGVILILIGKEE